MAQGKRESAIPTRSHGRRVRGLVFRAQLFPLLQGAQFFCVNLSGIKLRVLLQMKLATLPGNCSKNRGACRAQAGVIIADDDDCTPCRPRHRCTGDWDTFVATFVTSFVGEMAGAMKV